MSFFLNKAHAFQLLGVYGPSCKYPKLDGLSERGLIGLMDLKLIKFLDQEDTISKIDDLVFDNLSFYEKEICMWFDGGNERER